MPTVQLRPEYAYFTAIQYNGDPNSLPPPVVEDLASQEDVKIQAGDWFVNIMGQTAIYGEEAFHKIFSLPEQPKTQLEVVGGVLRTVPVEPEPVVAEQSECGGECSSCECSEST